MEEQALNFQPKYKKIVELLLYMVHKQQSIDTYQAVKFLYLADRAHFNRYGRPITFEMYSALDHGPVATNTYDLLKNQNNDAMSKFGIEKLPFKKEKLDKIIYLSSPSRSVDHTLFSKSDLKVMDEILEEFGEKSFLQLRNITHDHFAYKSAWSKRGQSKSYPMAYEDMLDESSDKSAFIQQMAPYSSYMI